MATNERHPAAPKPGEVQITIVVRDGDSDPEKDRCGSVRLLVPKRDLVGLSGPDIATRYLLPSVWAAFNAVKTDA